jgi:hypothetical protein
MKKTLLPLTTAVLLIAINYAFECGNNPDNQRFKKMTVMYRDFQGANKDQYKLEEMTKNENGLILSHAFYNAGGVTQPGSYSLVYDNNSNIKEKKVVDFDKVKNKEVTVRITYINKFKDNKLVKTIITDNENVGKNDTIDYTRDATGEIILKKQSASGTGSSTMYNAGKPEKEMVKVKGAVTVIRSFTYGPNGLTSMVGFDKDGKEIEKIIYEYNAKGLITAMTDLAKNFSATYKYNPKGQMLQEDRTDKGVKSILVYEYNDAGLVSKISQKNEKQIRWNERTYTYE